MKNSIILLILVLSSCSQQAQNAVEVTGFASIKVDPDIVKVKVESFAQEMNYTDAVTNVNLNSNKIIATLQSNGFENVKSEAYSVRKLTDYSDHYADRGYRATQVVRIEFPVKKELIDKIINLLSGKSLSSEFDFSFELSDKRRLEARNSLVAEAVKNATAKMKLLANAGNFTPGKILKINYKELELIYEKDSGLEYKVDLSDKPKNMFSGLSISPVNISDDVTVIWEIK
jgi:uncharacterized protein YggE